MASITKDKDRESGKYNLIVFFHNACQVTTWFFVFLSTIGIAVKLAYNEDPTSVTRFTLFVLKIAQTLQAMDLIFSLMKMTKTPFDTAFMQIFQRNLFAWFFLNDVKADVLVNMLLPWSIADSTRYLYYIIKDNKPLGHLRYNLFIILYPLGVFGEIRMLNGKILKYPQHQIAIILMQVVTVAGMAYIYKTLLSSRKKFYSGSSTKKVKEGDKDMKEYKKDKKEKKK